MTPTSKQGEDPVAGIRREDMPAMYQAADGSSLSGQQRFLKATRIRLWTLILAAIAGTIPSQTPLADIASFVAVVMFGCALASEIYILRSRPDREWYDGRAVAESVKTLTWRFIVGGEPFPSSAQTDHAPERLLIARLSEISRSLAGAKLVPLDSSGNRQQITASMLAARRLDLAGRRALYRKGRIEDQLKWYSAGARKNDRLAANWTLVLTIVEALGLILAVARAVGWFKIDVLGIASACVAGGVAWLQTKQYQNVSRAYAVAAQELSDILTQVNWPENEEQWSDFVDQAEEAISREHTMWRASRT